MGKLNNRDRRLLEYLRINLVGRWNLLNKPEKKYASELVKKFGWPVELAIQHAYFFAYDPWIYNYRSGRSAGCCKVDRSTGIINL